MLLDKFPQMFQASRGLFGSSAFDTEDNVSRALVLNRFDDSIPIQHSIAACTTDRRTSHLTTFGVGMLHRDVFCVEMNQPVDDAVEPGIDVLTGQVGVSRV